MRVSIRLVKVSFRRSSLVIRRGISAQIAALGLLIPALVGIASPSNNAMAAPVVSAPALVVGGLGNQHNPSLVGDTLVYDDCPMPYLPCNLAAYDYATNSTYQIANNVAYLDFQGAVQRSDGASVVWTAADQALYAGNLSDNSIEDLPATPGTRREVAVWGDIVVWTDGRAFGPTEPLNNDIYMLNRATRQEFPITENDADQNHPATNGKVIVWQDSRDAGAPQFNTDIYGYDIAAKKEFVIANSANSDLVPSISGNIVVWISQSPQNRASVMGYDLTTKRTFTIASPTNPSVDGGFVLLASPTIWGNIVTWVRNEYPQGPGYPIRSGIYGYDIATQQAFTVVDDDQAIRLSPAVSGNRLVWVEYSKAQASDGRRDIMGATLSGVTVAPIELPAPSTKPTSRTFPETGKTVTGKFLDYWMKHGGLPQQGFPISEVMDEVSDLDGKSYTVQYFERAVFEEHPENQPPYDVLLSQLGLFEFKEKHPEPQRPNPAEGMIKGRLSYPSEFIPSLAIYAIPTDGSKQYRSIRTWANSTEYTIEGVPPGTYYVVAYIADSPNNFLNMAYTKAAQCQRDNPTSSGCNDHTLVPVTVGYRETVEGIWPTDWSNEIKWPETPTTSPEATMCHNFEETGRLVCGSFLQYWYYHGGLAQQGYPISLPMTEVSDLDGKEYTVQYFERAVFEMHPENAPPFDVLLSQLGTFRYNDKYKP